MDLYLPDLFQILLSTIEVILVVKPVLGQQNRHFSSTLFQFQSSKRAHNIEGPLSTQRK